MRAGVQFFERDREFDLRGSGLGLAALARASPAWAGTWAAAETTSSTEQVCEKVCAIKEVVVSCSSCSTALLAKLVIVGSLVGVAQDFPGMLDLLKLCRVGGSAVWTRGLLVGVVLQREFAVRFITGGGTHVSTRSNRGSSRAGPYPF